MKIIKFEADWCGPCKMLTGVLDKMPDLPEIEVVNVDNDPDTTKLMNIRGIPTLVFVNDDYEELGRKVGVMTADVILDAIKLFGAKE